MSNKIQITDNKTEIMNKIIDLNFEFASGNAVDKQYFIQQLNNPPPNPNQTSILSYFCNEDNIIILNNIGTIYMISSTDIFEMQKYCTRIMNEKPKKILHKIIVKTINKQILKTHLHTPERMN